MKNLLKASLPILFLIVHFGCSNSPTNNNSSNTGDNNKDTTQSAENVASAANRSTSCDRPDILELTSAVYVSKNNYTLTYTWSSVSGITNYSFKFFLNGVEVFSNLSVGGTTITFPITIPSLDNFYAEVQSVCRSGLSSPKQSAQVEYKNAIAGGDIIFLADPTKSVNDICAASCQKIQFTGTTILNTDGTTINLTSNNAKVYYLDFSMVKLCIPCNGSTAQAKVDPTVFNSCLEDPVNELWIYDPNQYTVCP